MTEEIKYDYIKHENECKLCYVIYNEETKTCTILCYPKYCNNRYFTDNNNYLLCEHYNTISCVTHYNFMHCNTCK